MDDSYAIATPYNDAYNQVFAEFNPHGAPRVGAGDAANFLKKSNLPVATLGQIWELSDSTKNGSLDKRGAFVAFKLVAAAQQGRPINTSCLYDSSILPPKFGPPIPPSNLQHHFIPAFPSPGRAPPVPPPPHVSSQQSSPMHQGAAALPVGWPITAVDQQKYDSIFQSLNPVNGKLAGANVRPVLMNSGLDGISLARIWELSDQDKDGQLDRIEMTIALHLVYRALQSEPIPAQLPPSLIHPSKAMFAQRSPSYPPPRQFGSRAGSVTSLDDVHMSQSYNATMPRAAPAAPRAYSAQINGSRMSGNSTPISASIHSLSATANEWPINVSDYAPIFAQTDSNSDGLVDGQDMRAPMMASGLSAPILAHIWALADFKKCGQLDLEQFSLVMHLVEMAKRGEPTPNELPAYLVPPSFREPAVVQNTNQSVSTPQLPEATSMEIKEALEGDNEEVKELATAIQSMIIERKTAEESVVQLEADMNAKNSKIKNLQVELSTLESTVKQLERQKTEANRRLADYDVQIEQLEAACKAQKEKKEETEKRMVSIEEDAKNAQESKQNDEKEMEDLRQEIEQLDAQFRNVKSEVGREVGEREKMVSELTIIERKEVRDNIQMEKLSQEIEKVEKLTKEIVDIVEEGGEKMVNDFAAKPNLLHSSVEQSLFSDDTNYNEASTSNEQQFNNVHQPPDPFASARSNPSTDPFAQVDPFASQGQFDQAFPTDPFAQGAGFTPKPATPAPPRPAPPKGNSARATPVNDPFAPSQGDSTTQQSGNFANFADFGSAFNN